ncbi:MAG: putative MFS-type transporter [Ktedonobacterales bacterium]|jgi:MFS family permease|nr:MAG: putative MFS-type transporter [Ktedonobacterales bacterium]
MIATLRQRNFALLWFGGLISITGDWVLMVGLPIYVFLLTHSVLATSLMYLAGRAPSVLLASLAGVFVDRWDRKRTMVITNVLLALALLPVLLARTPDHVWIIYIAAFVESCIEQFFTPAESALLPNLVGEEHLVSANSLNALSNNLARLVGPAVGGVIAGVFGLSGIVLVDAASFLLAALLIALIAAPHRVSTATSASLARAEAGALARVGREWLDGMRAIFSSRTLTVVLVAISITALGEGVMGVLFPVFVNRVLHGGALQIGQLMSAQAVGGLIGGLLVGFAGQRVMSRWVIGFCGMAFGLLDLAIFNSPAFYPVFWLSVGLFIAVGIPGIGMFTGVQSLAQAAAPDAYRGRVFGAVGMTMGLLGLLGSIIAGTITDHLGVVTVLNIQGAGYVVAGLLLLLLLPKRQPSPATSETTATAEAPVAAEV